MPVTPAPSVYLQAAATAVPRTCLTTAELLAAHGHLLSSSLADTIARMGVQRRFVAMANAPAYLTGREDTLRMEDTATTLACSALRACRDARPFTPADVGLLIAVTNTQARLLPGLAPEILAVAPGLFSSSCVLVNLQGQGCSGLQKAVEVAGWFLASHPDQLVAVVASEANSAFAPLVRDRDYLSFTEIGQLPPGSDWMAELAKTGAMVQNFLFGDGAAAWLLGREEGRVAFGASRHRTNVSPEHQDLVRIDGGGSASPLVGPSGRPIFLLDPGVLSDGAGYVHTVVHEFLAERPFGAATIPELSSLLLHTGSKRILDDVCRQLGVARDSAVVAPGYATLRDYGNLSSASVGFMVAQADLAPGPGVMAGFGGGFSATATAIRVA